MSRIKIKGQLDPNDPKAAALLDQLSKLIRENPLLDFGPHAKQAAFLEADARVRVFLGGNRAGKSTVGVVDDLVNTLPAEFVPDHLKRYKKLWKDDVRGRVVTPDLGHTLKAVYEVYQRWVPPAALRGGTWSKAFDKQDRILNFKNGSFIEFMSYEQDLNKFGGSARDWIHYDEEPPGERGEAIRKECRMRLADRGGYEIFTFTPLTGLSWAYDEFWENRGDQLAEGVWGSGRIRVVLASMLDNPHLTRENIEEALSGLTEEELAARRDGQFSHFQGLVYSEFDYDIHTCEPVSKEHLKGQDVRIGIDPGIKTTAIVFVAFDRDNRALVFDEMYLHGEHAIPDRAVAKIKQRLAEWEVRSSYNMIDPASRNRSNTDHQRVQSLYTRAGLPVLPAQNDVETGVFEVKRRLQHTDHVGRPDPLLVIARNCKKLLWERARYRYEFTPEGDFGVEKKDDHGLDATRYVLMSRPIGPPIRSRNRQYGREVWVPNRSVPMSQVLDSGPQYGPNGKFS